MNKSVLACGLSAAILLTGCGGGGGGSGGGGSSSNPPSQSATTVSGTAVKGIIRQGLVTAIELDAVGNELGEVGSTTTAADGTYSLELNDSYQGGVIKLTITADASTRMVCDSYSGCGAAEFGDPIALPLNFSMNAVVPAVSNGGSVSTPITPLTHMVAARALAQPEINKAVINNAVSELNQLVGVNIMQTQVIDITSSAAVGAADDNAKQLALFNAGLADLIVNGGDIAEQLDSLANSFSDGQFDGTDDIAIGDILNAMSHAAQQASMNPQLQDAADDLDQVVAVVNSQVEGGNYNPEPTSNANANEIAQAKSLITDARTFLDVVASDYEEPIDALEVDKETIEQIMSDQSSANLMLLGEVLDQVITNLDNQGVDLLEELQNPSNYPTAIMDGDTEIGSVTTTFQSSAAGFAMLMTGSVQSVNINLLLSTTISADDLDIEGDIIQALTTDGETLALTGTVGDDTTSITLNPVALSFTLANQTEVILDDEESVQQAEDAITTISFDGSVEVSVQQAQFSGSIEVELVRLQPGVSLFDEVVSISRVALSGYFSPEQGESFSASVSLNVDNATQFDVLSYLSGDFDIFGSLILEGVPEEYTSPHLDAEQILEAAEPDYWDVNPDTFEWYASNCEQNHCTHMTIDFIELANPGPVYTLLIHNTGPEANDKSQEFFTNAYPLVEEQLGYGDALGYLYLDSFYYSEGNYYVYYYVNGVQEESETNYLNGNLLITVEADAADLPAATITAFVDRNQYQGGEASITVAYAGQSFTLDVEGSEDENGIAGTISLSNADGVDLTLNIDGEDDIEGVATVNGVQVGTVDTTDDGLTLIRYNDGTFESLF